jgi:hypothetical protein
MGRDLEAPSLPNDSSSEASIVRERPIVQFPTTEKDKDDWQSKFASMRESGSSSTKDILPGLELVGDLNPFGDKNSTRGTNGGAEIEKNADRRPPAGEKELLTAAEPKQLADKGSTGDQSASNDSMLLAPVQDHLRKLQQDESALNGDDQNKGDDDPGSQDTAVEVNGLSTSAPIYSDNHLASVEKIGAERKEKFEKEFGDGNSVEQRNFENMQTLAASAQAGDVASLMSLLSSGLPPQGIEKVSIFDLKTQKDSDGQVVLLAPRGDGAYSDAVPLVRNDGRPVSAMELGQYLRPDGTLFMGVRGQAYRPGDTFAMSLPEVPTLETPIVPPVVAEQNELMGATASVRSGILETKEKFATLRDSKLEARSLDVVGTDPAELEHHKSDLVSEPKEAAQEQRSIRTRLGETLRSIALRDLNDVRNWQLLAEKNNLPTDTDSKGNPVAALQRGMILTLPNASEIENFQQRASLTASSQLT